MNSKHSLGTNVPAPISSDEAAAYATLSQLVYADQPLADTLTELIGLAREVLTETPDVSLTLVDETGASTPVSTGPLALQLDHEQYDTDSGPCLDAALYGETIALAMADPDLPYAQFRAAARLQGVTHTLSVGLPSGDHALAALNLYSSAGRTFSDDSQRIAKTFAAGFGIILASLGRYRQAAVLAAQLQVALQSRASIDQAKGILMANLGWSAEDAFKVLVRQSQDQNIKLRVLAEQLIQNAAQPQV